jgi:hypothetical protein
MQPRTSFSGTMLRVASWVSDANYFSKFSQLQVCTAPLTNSLPPVPRRWMCCKSNRCKNVLKWSKAKYLNQLETPWVAARPWQLPFVAIGHRIACRITITHVKSPSNQLTKFGSFRAATHVGQIWFPTHAAVLPTQDE